MWRSGQRKMVTLDGRVGEGGGQVVRVAVALAALTGTPIRINNVRGNRPGKRGGGLKAQHVSCIKCLADATDAEVKDCFVGSKSFEFQSKLPPTEIKSRNIRIKAESAASVLLVFQSILPFLVFAGDESGSPITVTIQGGTNVSFSLSFEYLDQVLLPALERFGIKVDRKLEYRGWSHGTAQIGSVKYTIQPVPLGQSLRSPNWPLDPGTATKIEVSIIAPKEIHESLKISLPLKLAQAFPGVESKFVVVEDSRHPARIYTLAVAHSSTGLQFGRDCLYEGKTKNKSSEELSQEVSRRVVSELVAEIEKGGVVDEYLQDQLIIFQALAEGKSSIPGSLDTLSSHRERVERTDEPFGDGSMHTTTARWVVSQLLPQVKWIDKGRVCEGVGWKTPDSLDMITREVETLDIT